jgi:hypothetical protein
MPGFFIGWVSLFRQIVAVPEILEAHQLFNVSVASFFDAEIDTIAIAGQDKSAPFFSAAVPLSVRLYH